MEGGRVCVGIALLLLACDATTRPSVCADVDDVEVVAAGPAVRWDAAPALRELWRTGADSLALPVALVIADDRRAAVVDFGRRSVPVIGADGAWLRTWTGAANDANAVAMPLAAAWMDRSTLGIFDLMRSRILYLQEGAVVDEVPVTSDFSGPIQLAGELAWARLGPDGSVFATSAAAPLAAGDGRVLQSEYLLRVRRGAQRVDTVATTSVPTLFSLPGVPVPGAMGLLAAVGPSSELAVSDTSGVYLIRISDAAGRKRILCSATQPLPLRRAERGDTAVGDGREFHLASALQRATPASSPHPFGRLLFDADGRLWVQRERPNPFDPADRTWGVASATHDVYSPDLEYLGVVEAAPGTRLQSARGDTIWAFAFDEEGGVEIVTFSIEGNVR